MSEIAAASPDGRIVVRFWTSDQGEPVYRVDYDGEPLILDSRLGLEFDDAPPMRSGFAVARHFVTTHDGAWSPPYGERERIPDRYTGLDVTLKERRPPNRELQITFRIYDEGVGFHYTIPEQPGLKRFIISAERSQFHFPEGCIGYEEHGAEGEYRPALIKDIRPYCERPLTVAYPDGRHVCLTEANLRHYSRMLLSVNEEDPWVVESALSGLLTGFVGYGGMAQDLPPEWSDERVRAQTPFATPWRVLIVGDEPGDLLERNYLVLNLNEPCRIEDTRWIVPGKAIRDVSLSTEGAKACIDFASQRGFQYILFDAGWYGDPYDVASDAARVAGRPWFANKSGRDHPGLDMREVISYANAHDIGVTVYIDRRAAETQIDRLLPVYKEWGIRGIKIGFVNTGPQKWTEWLADVVEKCAAYEMVVNVHDAYRPTGLSRTYPNLLTQEGVRGNEHMPTPRHNTILPFTRFVAGAADYTICYYTLRKQTTHAHQLAMAVIVYSPYQPIFWYDRPSSYQGEQEVEFFERVPTVWSETRVICGRIGEYAVVARRSGDEWFVGAITNEQGRDLCVNLEFLEAGRTYVARIYADATDDDESRTKVAIGEREVDSGAKLTMRLAPGGGQAVHIAPRNGGER